MSEVEVSTDAPRTATAKITRVMRRAERLGTRSVMDSAIWRNTRTPCHFGRHFKGCVKAIYGYMDDRAQRNPRRFCYAWVKTIAKRKGYSLSEVYRAVQILEQLGAITAAEFDGKPGWIVAEHSDWTHPEGSKCVVSRRSCLSLIGKKRAANRKKEGSQSENPIPISTINPVENTENIVSDSAPRFLKKFQLGFSEEFEESQNRSVECLTEKPETREEPRVTVREVFSEVVCTEDLDEILEAISFERLDVSNRSVAKFKSKDQLRKSCLKAINELRELKFSGRDTCYRVMNRTMVILRKDFGLDAPKPWILVLRQLREESAIETVEEVDDFVERYMWVDPAKPEPVRMSEAELDRARSRPLREDAIWISFQLRAAAQPEWMESILPIFKTLQPLGRADTLPALKTWLERATEVARPTGKGAEFFETILREVESLPGGTDEGVATAA